MECLAWISRHVSKPSCLRIVDAGPSHVLTKRWCRLLLSCIPRSAICYEGAAKYEQDNNTLLLDEVKIATHGY